jgi:hypothetical protein
VINTPCALSNDQYPTLARTFSGIPWCTPVEPQNFPVGPSEFKPKLEFNTIELRGTPDLEPGDDIEDGGIFWQLSIGSRPLPAYFTFTQLLEPREACDNERDQQVKSADTRPYYKITFLSSRRQFTYCYHFLL